ncbi:MAG: AgmX/PglI C-terminal domain-containing protein [Kofleriaceae bacterium]
MSVLLVSATASAEPFVELGQPTVSGEPGDRVQLIDATVGNQQPTYLKCYDPAGGLRALHVTMIIRTDGKLAAVGTATANKDKNGIALASCVKTALLALHFEAQPAKTTVDYSFVFHPQPIDDAYGGLLGNEAGEMNGGFGYGRSGFGPGGGGTGWGTIGTGGQGPVGRPKTLPSTTLGQANVTGDLDKAIIRRYIKRNIQKLEYCYEKTLLAKPGLKGTVTAKFTIDSGGLVSASTASGLDKDVSDCVARVIKDIEFPKPKSGTVDVTYPFEFRAP